MTTVELLSALRNKGIKLWAEGGQLRYSAPANTVPSDFLPFLRERQTEIIEFLLEANNGDSSHSPGIQPVRRDKATAIPQSFAHGRLWFLDHLPSNTSAYNLP